MVGLDHTGNTVFIQMPFFMDHAWIAADIHNYYIYIYIIIIYL